MAQAADPAPELALARGRRIANLWWAAGALAILILSRLLTPDPSGHGTRPSLWPIPCLWRVSTGLPCPSCGMTTAFVWMARGEPRRAWQCNPLGPPAYVLTWVVLVWALAAAARGRGGPGAALESRRVLVGLIAVYLGVWVVRLLFLVAGEWRA